MTIFERIYMTMTMLRDREEGEKGAAMVEYALLVAGIAVVVGAAALALGGRVRDMFATLFP